MPTPVAITQITATTNGTQLPTPTTGDPTNGHFYNNSGRTKVHVKNTNAGSTARNVTFPIVSTVDGQSVTSKTKSIPAGQTFVFGPFDPNIYGNQPTITVDNAEVVLHAVD